MQRSLQVSGIGVISAFGTSHAAFRDGLLEGRSGIAPLSGFDTSECRTTLAAQVTGFEPAKWVAPMKLRRLDRTGVYALALAQLVLADAQRTPTPDGDDRSGVVLGTWTAGGQSTQQYLDAFFRSGPANAPALLFDSTVANSAASLAGMEYKLRGPNVTVSHKEASGLGAIVCAAELLRGDRACGLLTGGVDAVFEPFFKAHDRFAVMSGDAAFSRRQSPFDCERAGFVLGEGGFGLWLQQSDDRTDGRDEAVVGVAAAGAAVGLNLWPDKPEPLVRTMRLALEDAGLSPDDVDVVYASANATGLDATEAEALIPAFRRQRGGRHVAQGSARRIRRVRRGRLCGRVPVRTRGAGAADCGPGEADRCSRAVEPGLRRRSMLPDRSCWSTVLRAAARCSAWCCARRQPGRSKTVPYTNRM